MLHLTHLLAGSRNSPDNSLEAWSKKTGRLSLGGRGLTPFLFDRPTTRIYFSINQPHFMAPQSITLQLAFHFFECSECGFSSVQLLTFNGSEACPLCAGDSGHDVRMSRRIAMPEDKPEGYDARKHI